MKEEKKINFSVESVQDLNSSNIWSMTAEQIGKMWEKERLEEDSRRMNVRLVNTQI